MNSILVTVHRFVYITFQLFVYNFLLIFLHLFQLPSFAECFRSIFRIHSETGNIWTHLIGFVAFVIATIVFYVKPFCDFCHHDIQVSSLHSVERPKISSHQKNISSNQRSSNQRSSNQRFRNFFSEYVAFT